MSVQMAGVGAGDPARRRAGWGRLCGRASSRSKAPEALAPQARSRSTCGRCETQAMRRSWASACTATGCAPRRSISSRKRPYSASSVVAAGVRYQVAPSKRSSRALPTPAVSAPASGWPPTKRGSWRTSFSASFVEPTSLTTQSGRSGQAPGRRFARAHPTGAAAKTTCAPATAAGMSARLLVDGTLAQGARKRRADRGHSRTPARRREPAPPGRSIRRSARPRATATLTGAHAFTRR